MLEIQGSGELHLPAKRAVENVVAHFLLGGGLQRGVRHPKTDGAAPCVVSVNYHFLQSQNTTTDFQLQQQHPTDSPGCLSCLAKFAEKGLM
jgi:hypothetical protein